MILRCSHKLAAKFSNVSPNPLQETSPLGSWHGHLYTLDRRQCVMFCRDASRFVLFLLDKFLFGSLPAWGLLNGCPRYGVWKL